MCCNEFPSKRRVWFVDIIIKWSTIVDIYD